MSSIRRDLLHLHPVHLAPRLLKAAACVASMVQRLSSFFGHTGAMISSPNSLLTSVSHLSDTGAVGSKSEAQSSLCPTCPTVASRAREASGLAAEREPSKRSVGGLDGWATHRAMRRRHPINVS